MAAKPSALNELLAGAAPDEAKLHAVEFGFVLSTKPALQIFSLRLVLYWKEAPMRKDLIRVFVRVLGDAQKTIPASPNIDKFLFVIQKYTPEQEPASGILARYER